MQRFRGGRVALVMGGLLLSAASTLLAQGPLEEAMTGGPATTLGAAAEASVVEPDAQSREDAELLGFLATISTQPTPTDDDPCGCRGAWAACHDACGDDMNCWDGCFSDLQLCKSRCGCCIFPGFP